MQVASANAKPGNLHLYCANSFSVAVRVLLTALLSMLILISGALYAYIDHGSSTATIYVSCLKAYISIEGILFNNDMFFY